MANGKRLIDANDTTVKLAANASHVLRNADGDDYTIGRARGIMDAVDLINKLHTVDAVEEVHGRWEDVKETSLYVPDMKYTVTHTAETCSACKVRIGFIGSKPYLYDNICPHCGAKMDGDKYE